MNKVARFLSEKDNGSDFNCWTQRSFPCQNFLSVSFFSQLDLVFLENFYSWSKFRQEVTSYLTDSNHRVAFVREELLNFLFHSQHLHAGKTIKLLSVFRASLWEVSTKSEKQLDNTTEKIKLGKLFAGKWQIY